MAADVPHETIDALQWEQRRFPPPEGFKADALATGTDLYEDAAEDDEGFWARQAEELVSWSAPWPPRMSPIRIWGPCCLI